MQTDEKTKDHQTERMDGAFQEIQHAMNRVDIWAGALAGFLKPVPQGARQLLRESR